MVTFTLFITRKGDYYWYSYVIPMVITSMMTILGISVIIHNSSNDVTGLFLPSSASYERTERVTMGLTALMSIAVILISVSDKMPRDPTQYPILGCVNNKCKLCYCRLVYVDTNHSSTKRYGSCIVRIITTQTTEE